MATVVDTYRLHLAKSERAITEPVTKFGGNPAFLEPALWPRCRMCSRELDFLGQIRMDDPIRFSNRYLMAYLFMCVGYIDKTGALQCETWDPYEDANAVILQSSSKPVFVESGRDRAPAYPDYEVTLERSDDPAVDVAELGIDDEDLFEAVYDRFKIGGVPRWLQSNDTPTCPGCGGRMIFVAQLDAALDGRLPADPKEWDEDKYKFFHFGGDDGVGYLFLCENECGPRGAAFLWQCT